MNPLQSENIKWCENIIIADADYIDHVAFDLTVNFERIINRRIPKADLAQWAVCMALDGGVKEGENHTQLILIHDKEQQTLQNFVPGDHEKELDGKAFNDPQLGEFAISSYPVEASVVSKTTFLVDIAQTICNAGEVKRVMIVADAEHSDAYDQLRSALRHIDDDGKRITLFAMAPLPGGNFRQEILGYSLMNALGIKASEIK